MSEMLGASLFDTSLCHVDRRVLVGTPLVSGAFHLAGACKRSAYTITMVGFFTDASLDPAGAPPPPPASPPASHRHMRGMPCSQGRGLIHGRFDWRCRRLCQQRLRFGSSAFPNYVQYLVTHGFERRALCASCERKHACFVLVCAILHVCRAIACPLSRASFGRWRCHYFPCT